MEKNKTKKHKKGQKTKRCLLSSTRHQGSTVFSFVFFLPLKSWITKKQNNSNEKADKSAGGTVALEVEKERKSKESAGTGETLTAELSTQNRPPDLCRKQKEEVVIMWLITMRMSDKSQYDFDMSVYKKKGEFRILVSACWNLITLWRLEWGQEYLKVKQVWKVWTMKL